MPKLTVRQALKKHNEKYASMRLPHDEVKAFKTTFEQFRNNIKNANDNDENEEYFKKIINDFLKLNFYRECYYEINTKNDIDSVIKCNGEVFALLEAKRPKNTNEMVRENDINKKALWELIYYLLKLTRNIDGRSVRRNNSEIRRVVISDGFKWYIFDAHDIDKLCDGFLENLYFKYMNNQLAYGRDTSKFYDEISRHLTEINVNAKLNYVFFDIDDIDTDKITLLSYVYKLLSKEYLLKEKPQIPIQSHTLNERFYQELLYIMGLEEKKSKTKTVIEINDSVKNTFAEQVYNEFINEKGEAQNIAVEKTFELVIIWLNRILFIKLFEAQLLQFNGDDDSFRILDNNKITSFAVLSNIFFDVLGTKNRDERFDKFKNIPYLNSSLFERQNLEREISIKQIENVPVKIKANSILKSKRNRNLYLLEYIIDFLNSYSFVSNSGDNFIDNNEIIDVAVLGLIFEKLNGYKDGAFFTPPVITEYMCKEVIEKAVLNKVNTVMKWKCKELDDIVDKIENRDQRKQISDAINTLKICDPSVGSGHFLVSALNRIIAIKYQLGVLLMHESGKRFNECEIFVENDVLVVKNEDGTHFSYNKNNKGSREIQETLFNEKRVIIEECLFGVDINPKAVYITQLRLWIELLKNAYYKNGIMETLPNIDINIKVGNSLISKVNFVIGERIKEDSDETRRLIINYRALVKKYKREINKFAKKQLEDQIEYKKTCIRGALKQLNLFDDTEETLGIDYKKANSFEWAFEFPEVLDGLRFLGFDVVIGNPPYISALDMVKNNVDEREAIKNSKRYLSLHQKWDLYIPFMELGFQILKNNGNFAMIVPYPLTNQIYAKIMREIILKHYNLIEIVDLNGTKIFENATVSNCIMFINKSPNFTDLQCLISNINEQKQITPSFVQSYADLVQDDINGVWNLTQEKRVKSRHSDMNVLGDFCYISKGMVINADEKTAKGEFTKKDLISDEQDEIHCRMYIEGKDIERYNINRIRYLEYNTERCPDKISRPTFRELYNCKKLLINKLGTIKVTIDTEKLFLHDQTLRCAILWNDLKGIENKSIDSSIKRYSRHSREEMEDYSKQVDLYYLLGILNSTYAMILLTNQRGGDYNISPEHMRNLPIPLVAEEQQQPIVDLVSKILSAKQKDSDADTSALETEINKLVYELYGLTDMENGVVVGVES